MSPNRACHKSTTRFVLLVFTEDIHAVSRNASDTQPAKFLVVMVKSQGAPVTVPVK